MGLVIHNFRTVALFIQPFFGEGIDINTNKMGRVGMSTEIQAVETQNSIEQGALP